MCISELARAKASAKAVRYYQQLGLVALQRRPNGYREYDEIHLRVVRGWRRHRTVQAFRKRLGTGHLRDLIEHRELSVKPEPD